MNEHRRSQCDIEGADSLPILDQQAPLLRSRHIGRTNSPSSERSDELFDELVGWVVWSLVIS